MTASRPGSVCASLGYLAVVGALLAGCASAAEPAATTNAASTGAEATGAEATGAEATPAEPVLSEVSWQFFELLRIDPEGNLYRGDAQVGHFAPNGDLVARDGGVVRLEPDGTLVLDGDRTDFRIVNGVVFERATAVMHIEQSVLILGGESEEERVPLEHFHPARTREVLMTSTLMLIGMAAAYAH